MVCVSIWAHLLSVMMFTTYLVHGNTGKAIGLLQAYGCGCIKNGCGWGERSSVYIALNIPHLNSFVMVQWKHTGHLNKWVFILTMYKNYHLWSKAYTYHIFTAQNYNQLGIISLVLGSLDSNDSLFYFLILILLPFLRKCLHRMSSCIQKWLEGAQWNRKNNVGLSENWSTFYHC